MKISTNVMGATFLVAGCSIGAGMLGLPVVSASAGMIPTTVAMLICYVVAVAMGLFIAEATLWFKEEVNLVSLATYALGRVGKWIAWSFFLFLFYCVFVAYISGGGSLFTQLFSFSLGYEVSREIGIFFIVILVLSIICFGAKGVSYLSRVFLLGLAISYGALITLGISHIKMDSLKVVNWSSFFPTVPVLLFCFGYQNLVPTLVYYVKKDIRAARFAIIVGTFIPFVVYFFWNVVILGLMPVSSLGVAQQGGIVTDLLQRVSSSEDVLFFVNAFSLFAVLTPFIACAVAFVDFLRDGFKKMPQLQYDPFLYGLTLIPPTLLTLVYPDLFLKALGFAGGFLDMVLFGLLPCMIVWVGRYVKNVKGAHQVWGGKPFLCFVFLFCFSVIVFRFL